MILGYKKTAFTEPFVLGAGGRLADIDEILANRSWPMAVSGLTKSVVPNQARLHGLDWYYIDTGYMGNRLSKIWFRVTKNACQNTGPILDRPNDRLQKMILDRTRYTRGRQIMIVPPDIKVCQFYHLGDPHDWLRETKRSIASRTNRPIVVRERPASRNDRMTTKKFIDALREDVNAVVVYSSNCAVESAMHGIPVVCLGESAARPIAGDLDQIDSLDNLDTDLVDRWLRHLSYCQFTQKEMRSGLAWEMVNGA